MAPPVNMPNRPHTNQLYTQRNAGCGGLMASHGYHQQQQPQQHLPPPPPPQHRHGQVRPPGFLYPSWSSQAAAAAAAATIYHLQPSGGTAAARHYSRPMPPLTDDTLRNVIVAGPEEHRLQYTWTFWYLRFEKNFSWEHSQVDVATFSTVESFWGVFDALLPLTEVHYGCNYSLFKKGIRPIWEDPMNRQGGRFIFAINKEEPDYKAVADAMWLEFCMLLVGHWHPEHCRQICGIVAGNRNNLIKIAVWIRESHCVSRIAQIGQFLKELVRFDKPVSYEVHMNQAGGGAGGAPGRGTLKL